MEEGGILTLLDKSMEKYRILNRVRTDDDYGGYRETWTDGMTFDAAMAKNSTTEQQIAEKEGITESFTFVVNENVTLDYHDVFKRLSDGAIFRTTSRTVDSVAHPMSTIRIAKITAERWELK